MATNWAELCKNPLWQKTRLHVFTRDRWTCTHCANDNKTLHCHHRTKYVPGRMPWEYDLSELQTLCEDCHGMLKGIKDPSRVTLDGGSWSYNGGCPWCDSQNIKNKGSHDKCMDCFRRIDFWPPTEMAGEVRQEHGDRRRFVTQRELARKARYAAARTHAIQQIGNHTRSMSEAVVGTRGYRVT